MKSTDLIIFLFVPEPLGSSWPKPRKNSGHIFKVRSTLQHAFSPWSVLFEKVNGIGLQFIFQCDWFRLCVLFCLLNPCKLKNIYKKYNDLLNISVELGICITFGLTVSMIVIYSIYSIHSGYFWMTWMKVIFDFFSYLKYTLLLYIERTLFVKNLSLPYFP